MKNSQDPSKQVVPSKVVATHAIQSGFNQAALSSFTNNQKKFIVTLKPVPKLQDPVSGMNENCCGRNHHNYINHSHKTPVHIKSEDSLKGKTILNAFRLLTNRNFVTIDQNYSVRKDDILSPYFNQLRLYGGNEPRSTSKVCACARTGGGAGGGAGEEQQRREQEHIKKKSGFSPFKSKKSKTSTQVQREKSETAPQDSSVVMHAGCFRRKSRAKQKSEEFKPEKLADSSSSEQMQKKSEIAQWDDSGQRDNNSPLVLHADCCSRKSEEFKHAKENPQPRSCPSKSANQQRESTPRRDRSELADCSRSEVMQKKSERAQRDDSVPKDNDSSLVLHAGWWKSCAKRKPEEFKHAKEKPQRDRYGLVDSSSSEGDRSPSRRIRELYPARAMCKSEEFKTVKERPQSQNQSPCPCSQKQIQSSQQTKPCQSLQQKRPEPEQACKQPPKVTTSQQTRPCQSQKRPEPEQACKQPPKVTTSQQTKPCQSLQQKRPEPEQACKQPPKVTTSQQTRPCQSQKRPEPEQACKQPPKVITSQQTKPCQSLQQKRPEPEQACKQPPKVSCCFDSTRIGHLEKQIGDMRCELSRIKREFIPQKEMERYSVLAQRLQELNHVLAEMKQNYASTVTDALSRGTTAEEEQCCQYYSQHIIEAKPKKQFVTRETEPERTCTQNSYVQVEEEKQKICKVADKQTQSTTERRDCVPSSAYSEHGPNNAAKKMSSFCLHCQNQRIPVLGEDVPEAVMRTIADNNVRDVALTVVLQRNNLYHINVAIMRSGQTLGCLLATEHGIAEANREHLFDEFPTFFIVDTRNTPEQKSRLLTQTFEITRG